MQIGYYFQIVCVNAVIMNLSTITDNGVDTSCARVVMKRSKQTGYEGHLLLDKLFQCLNCHANYEWCVRQIFQ